MADDLDLVKTSLLEEAAKLLEEIVGQKKPNQWGYDAAYIAMGDGWRFRARDFLVLFRSYEEEIKEKDGG